MRLFGILRPNSVTCVAIQSVPLERIRIFSQYMPMSNKGGGLVPHPQKCRKRGAPDYDDARSSVVERDGWSSTLLSVEGVRSSSELRVGYRMVVTACQTAAVNTIPVDDFWLHQSSGCLPSDTLYETASALCLGSMSSARKHWIMLGRMSAQGHVALEARDAASFVHLA